MWAAFILILCLIPGSDLPGIVIPHFDKIVHFTFYFILAILMYLGWKRQSRFASLHLHSALKIIMIAAVYGLLIEVLQGTLTADRQFDLLDALTNTGGAVAACLISVKLFP